MLLQSLINTAKLHFLTRGTYHALFSCTNRQAALSRPEVHAALAQSSRLASITLKGLSDIEKVCVYSNICNSLRLQACIVLGPLDSSVEIVKWSQQVTYTLAELGPVSLFDLKTRS